MARYIGVYLEVESDGKIELRKAEEFTGPDFATTNKTVNNAKVLPADLYNEVRGSRPVGAIPIGHNAIGVLVSNPTCFIVGGQMICI